MPIAQGIDSYVTVGVESAFGTVATVGKRLAILASDIRGSQPRIPNQASGGDRNSRKPVLGRIDAGGSLSMYAGVDSFPIWARAITGGLTTTGAADPFTHTSKTTNVRPASITVETFFDLATDKWKQLLGGEVDQASFTVNDEGFLVVNLTIAGRETVMASSAFHAGATDWTNENPFENLQIAAGAVLLDGTAIAQVSKVEVQVANNLKKDCYVVGGAGKRRDLPFGRQEVTGTVDLYFEDLVAYNLATGGAATSIDVTWSQGAGRSLQLVLDDVYLEKNDPDATSDGPLMLSLPYRCAKDSVAATQLKFVAQNANNAATYA